MLFLDEPTAGQDYRHYTEIMEFLKKLNEEYGITIIMITHDMHLMLEYTNRAVVIADGRLLADTAPAAVLTDDAVADRAYLKKTLSTIWRCAAALQSRHSSWSALSATSGR